MCNIFMGNIFSLLRTLRFMNMYEFSKPLIVAFKSSHAASVSPVAVANRVMCSNPAVLLLTPVLLSSILGPDSNGTSEEILHKPMYVVLNIIIYIYMHSGPYLPRELKIPSQYVQGVCLEKVIECNSK